MGLRPQISAEKHFKHPNYWKDRAPKRATELEAEDPRKLSKW